MQVDALAIRLRPRPMAEAADLGVLLVHRHARSIVRTWVPVYAVVALVALATIEISTWLPSLIIFWLKPWMDRTLLFTLSRAVFGESTRFADLWQQRSAVWWRELVSTLTLRRFSPWRPYTQPISQLEGQRGKSRRQRRSQLLNGKRGAAFGLHFVFAHLEIVFCLGLLMLLLWFAPQGTHRHVMAWFTDAGSTSSANAFTAAYAVAVFVLEPFYVASGFGMYLNRRVELESWDIEQEFRRAFA